MFVGDRKVIRDPVHCFIEFPKNGIIHKIIDTPEYQRLKYIHQLGVSYFTYPGATHNRFSHCLGAYWLANQLGKILDLSPYDNDVLSLAALLHDIGHGPFSHVFEKKILDQKHEDIGKQIISSGELEIYNILNKSGNLDDVNKIFDKIDQNKLHLIVSSQIDVDRFDYLLRDSLYTGNPHGTFDIRRIIYSIKRNDNNQLYISDKGINSIEHYLICRYQMNKQVYYHHSTLSAETILNNILKRAKYEYERGKINSTPIINKLLNQDLNIQDFITITDNEILSFIYNMRKHDDKILSDLINMFINRKLLKCLDLNPILEAKGLHVVIDIQERINELIDKDGKDVNYYFSIFDLRSKPAYRQYSAKDTEEAIWVNSKCDIEITNQVKSLKAVEQPQIEYIFYPSNLFDAVQEIVNESLQ